MVDGAVCHGSLTVLISLYNEIVKLEERHLLRAVDGAKSSGETESLIEVDGLLDVVGGDADVLYTGCEIFDVHNVFGFFIIYNLCITS